MGCDKTAVGNHVVVEEETQSTSSTRDAVVSSRLYPSLFLRDHDQIERQLEVPESLLGPVTGAVRDDNHLETLWRFRLSSERTEQCRDPLTPVVRWHDDAEFDSRRAHRAGRPSPDLTAPRSREPLALAPEAAAPTHARATAPIRAGKTSRVRSGPAMRTLKIVQDAEDQAG